jgi:hypothetical protein
MTWGGRGRCLLGLDGEVDLSDYRARNTGQRRRTVSTMSELSLRYDMYRNDGIR